MSSTILDERCGKENEEIRISNRKKCISLALSIILLVNSYPILLAHAASAPTYDQVAQKYSLSYVDTYTISGHSYKYYDISYSAGTELPVFLKTIFW